jgi:hypothetical protein
MSIIRAGTPLVLMSVCIRIDGLLGLWTVTGEGEETIFDQSLSNRICRELNVTALENLGVR